MIKRRRFPVLSFEIFAEVHSQQTSLLSAFAIVRGLQIFLLPPSPLPPQIKNETVGSYQTHPGIKLKGRIFLCIIPILMN